MTNMSYSPDDTLVFSIAEDRDGVTVSLAGELDLLSLPDVGMALELAGARGTPVALDCGRLRFADAAALHFLRRARDRARSAGGDLTLTNTQGIVLRLLELTGSLSLAAGSRLPTEPVRVTPSRTAVLQAAVATAVQLAGTPRANLQLADPAVRRLRIAAQQGFRPPFLKFFDVVDDSSSACGAALHTGASVWVTDVARSPIYTRAAAQVMLDAGAAAVASVPVRAPDGELIAIISAHDETPRAWEDVTRLQLERLATVTGRLL